MKDRSNSMLARLIYGDNSNHQIRDCNEHNNIVRLDSLTTYEQAERDALRSKLKAALAKQLLDNTALLAITKEKLVGVAPSASREYDLIIQTYTKDSLIDLIGGEW